GVTTYERGKAKTLDSDLLASDAAHTLSDVWVTISVIIGLIAVKLGVAWMDSVVALAIVVLIAYTGWQIIRKTSRILVDAAPISAEALSQVVRGVSGVQKVLQARSRGVKEAVH